MTAHPHLTLTGLYNVLEALRSDRALTDAERDVLDAGQVATLRHLHDELDAAVADAYGWPVDLPTAEIVARVVALNAERLAEEQDGTVRWLRPEFQAPAEAAIVRRVQPNMVLEDVAAAVPWPKEQVAQFLAVRAALSRGTPMLPRELAKQWKGSTTKRLAPVLAVLASLGQAKQDGSGRFVA